MVSNAIAAVSDRPVRNGRYQKYERYLCKNCGRTFADKTGTIFAHSKLNLYEGDKPPVFTLVDRGSNQRYFIPVKSADESTARLLLMDQNEKPLGVYTDGFLAYGSLEKVNEFDREDATTM